MIKGDSTLHNVHVERDGTNNPTAIFSWPPTILSPERIRALVDAIKGIGRVAKCVALEDQKVMVTRCAGGTWGGDTGPEAMVRSLVSAVIDDQLEQDRQ